MLTQVQGHPRRRSRSPGRRARRGPRSVLLSEDAARCGWPRIGVQDGRWRCWCVLRCRRVLRAQGKADLLVERGLDHNGSAAGYVARELDGGTSTVGSLLDVGRNALAVLEEGAVRSLVERVIR